MNSIPEPWVSVTGHGRFTYNHEFSLLDSLQQQQLPIDYNCRSGYCGRCKIKLGAGRIVWIQDSLVSLQKGEILSCCCVPDGHIQITITLLSV